MNQILRMEQTKQIKNRLGLFLLFLFWFVKGTFNSQPIRWVVVTLTISLGISLAVAINIVNKSAITEFNHSTNLLRGDASYQIKAKTGFFNELIFEEFLDLKNKFGVSEVSPVLELSLITKDKQKLTIFGLDFFKVAKTNPIFLALPEQNKKNKLSVFSESAIFLSPITRKKFNISIGDSLSVLFAGNEVFFTVAGSLSNSVDGDLGVIDIASFQSAFNMSGKLSRLDFKVSNDNDFKQSKFLVNQYIKQSKHKHNLEVVDLTDTIKKNNSLSQAYYVNLSVLALVALFTGMFLVYSVISLAVQQQNNQYSLLRALGLTKLELASVVISKGFFLSLIGSTLGVFLGLIFANFLLSTLNANLGAGLIFQNSSVLHIDWLTLFAYWILGIIIGVFASLIPALKISKVSPQNVFTSAARKNYSFMTLSPWVFFVIIVFACLLLLLPTYNGIPLPSYISIALILISFIGIMPSIASMVFKFLSVFFSNLYLNKIWLWLGVNRLSNSSGENGPIISSVVASFALTIAILIMVASFKDSVIIWLDKLLVADLYGGVTNNSGYSNINEQLRENILKLSGVRKVEFSKNYVVSLDSSKVKINMIVRQIKHRNRETKLPLIGERLSIDELEKYVLSSDTKIVIYASESMKQLYNFELGQVLVIPFPYEKFSEVMIGGFYRDYSRQHGSLVVRESDFRRITSRNVLSNIALWVDKNSEPKQIIIAIKNLGGAFKEMNFKSSTKIREVSLKIFDRTFFVAYLLGVIALFISIFSIFCTYISQAKIREKEFSLLMYLGVSKSDIVTQTGFESGVLCFLGTIWGLIAGVCISLILIYIVNPQSFHWTMNFSFPTIYIMTMGFLLVVTGVITSRVAVRNELKKTQIQKVLKHDRSSFV